jgi:hypothetical protein
MSESNVSATAALLQAVKRAHRTLRKGGFDMAEIDAAIARVEAETSVSADTSPDELASLATDLDYGISSDIWYDAAQNEDRLACERIELTQNAMSQAARILRDLASKGKGNAVQPSL